MVTLVRLLPSFALSRSINSSSVIESCNIIAWLNVSIVFPKAKVGNSNGFNIAHYVIGF